ncbi:MAG: hypothetical protein WCQ26_11140 [Pseudanabaena sp. ELA748]
MTGSTSQGANEIDAKSGRGDLYLADEERLDIERHRADAAQKQVELLLAKLRSLGIDA